MGSLNRTRASTPRPPPPDAHTLIPPAHLVPRLHQALGQELSKGAKADNADLETAFRLRPLPLQRVAGWVEGFRALWTAGTDGSKRDPEVT